MNIRAKYAIVRHICILITIIVVMSLALTTYDYTHFTGINKEDELTYGDKFFNRLYLVCCSLSSIGYGDISPRTKPVRFLIVVVSVLMVYGAYGLFAIDVLSN